ncbi:hypothetical protein, partial [Ruminococcus sp. YE71]|uniref:hypothetical protein n=1 Tax=Ruminococcus sp. YE71 TaxID=244362 RepID=UPI001A9A2F67
NKMCQVGLTSSVFAKFTCESGDDEQIIKAAVLPRLQIRPTWRKARPFTSRPLSSAARPTPIPEQSLSTS